MKSRRKNLHGCQMKRLFRKIFHHWNTENFSARKIQLYHNFHPIFHHNIKRLVLSHICNIIQSSDGHKRARFSRIKFFLSGHFWFFIYTISTLWETRPLTIESTDKKDREREISYWKWKSLLRRRPAAHVHELWGNSARMCGGEMYDREKR